MKKLLFTCLLSVLFIFPGFAQVEYFDSPSEESFMDRVYFGGNFSAQFGNITFVDVSPLAGYMVTNRFSAGVGLTYQYLNYSFLNASAHTYGGRLFSRYNVTQQFFVYGEFENLNVARLRQSPTTNEVVRTREWIPGMPLGAGYFQPFGARGGMSIMALYNVLYEPNNPIYPSPWIFRIGFVL